MSVFDIPILVTFWLLMLFSLRLPQGWQCLRAKPIADWLLDVCGLAIQGVIIPALQIGLLYGGLSRVVPHWANRITLAPFVGFLICMVAVDYVYYWNHRWLHGIAWPLHKVHHTVTQLDVVSSSRNSVWSSFFIVYLWVHTLWLYLLSNPSGYLWGISLTAMLDLWRHSRLGPRAGSRWWRWLSPWLVLPQDHAWHHAHAHGCNFGANFKFWDRLHGTARRADDFPKKLGIPTTLSFWQKLLYPFETL